MCAYLQVLFPLLTKLLDNISPADVGGMEETRMRACTLLSKVSLTVTLNTHTHTGRRTQAHTNAHAYTLPGNPYLALNPLSATWMDKRVYYKIKAYSKALF